MVNLTAALDVRGIPHHRLQEAHNHRKLHELSDSCLRTGSPSRSKNALQMHFAQLAHKARGRPAAVHNAVNLVMMQEPHDCQGAWQMEVLLVRTAERLLDTAAGLPCVDGHLPSVHEPSMQQACLALRNMAPALAHLHTRACARCRPCVCC